MAAKCNSQLVNQSKRYMVFSCTVFEKFLSIILKYNFNKILFIRISVGDKGLRH